MESSGIKGASYAPPTVTRDKPKQTQANTVEPSMPEATRQALDRVDLAMEKKQPAQLRSLYGYSEIREQLDSANAQAKAVAKQGEVRRKCMLIAQRIMAGAKLDPKDFQYLLEHDTRTYQLVMSMRREDPDGKKEDRISRDEEGESKTGASDSSMPISPPASPVPPAPADELPSSYHI